MPVKLGTDHNYFTAVVVHPDSGPKLPEASLDGLGKIRWASPQLTEALGGHGLGSLLATARVYPLQPPAASALVKVQHGVELLDSAGLSLNDGLKGALDSFVQSKQLSPTGGNIFKSSIAGTQILLEIIDPTEKTVLEKMLSITLHGIEFAEPVTDFVPHLARAKPYLVAIVEVGGLLVAAIHTLTSEAQPMNLPGANYPRKPAALK
jgi:hypothetical protein